MQHVSKLIIQINDNKGKSKIEKVEHPMDTVKITEEAPEEYAELRQKREKQAAQIRKNINYILILCMAGLILLGCYTYMEYRIEARTMLGEAKNVELAVRLTAIQYYGYGSTPYDAGRESGLKEDAEKEVMRHADVEGQVRVLGWDRNANAPTGFVYWKGKMLVHYTLGRDGQPDWEVYRIQNILSAG